MGHRQSPAGVAGGLSERDLRSGIEDNVPHVDLLRDASRRREADDRGGSGLRGIELENPPAIAGEGDSAGRATGLHHHKSAAEERAGSEAALVDDILPAGIYGDIAGCTA